MNSINNIQNVFVYRSPAGEFTIKFDKGLHKWALSIKNETCGHYLNPGGAADDVYTQATGYNEWDFYDIDSILSEIPTDIHGWEIFKNYP